MSVHCPEFTRTLFIDGTVRPWGRNKVNLTCHHLNRLRNKEQSRTDFHSTKHGSLNKCPLCHTVWGRTEFLILGAVDRLDWSALRMGAGGALLCTGGCLAASLGSTHSTGVNAHSVSGHYQMFPRDHSRPQLRITGLEWNEFLSHVWPFWWIWFYLGFFWPNLKFYMTVFELLKDKLRLIKEFEFI